MIWFCSRFRWFFDKNQNQFIIEYIWSPKHTHVAVVTENAHFVDRKNEVRKKKSPATTKKQIEFHKFNIKTSRMMNFLGLWVQFLFACCAHCALQAGQWSHNNRLHQKEYLPPENFISFPNSLEIRKKRKKKPARSGDRPENMFSVLKCEFSVAGFGFEDIRQLPIIFFFWWSNEIKFY